MTPADIRSKLAKLEPWFQCIDLGNGLVTKTRSAIGEPVEHPQPTWKTVEPRLPQNLSGKSVIDVGCNAGFYSVEMKRRGAARVLGIDAQQNLIRQAEFVRDVLNLEIDYRRMSVYDLDPRRLGQFDVTLALGLIYHCKHLVLALEKLFTITRELLILETEIYPPEKTPESFRYELGGSEATLHTLAYIQNPPDAKEAIYNWFLPGVEALSALLRNVGFDEVEIHPGVESYRAVLACRKREPIPDSRMVAYLAAELKLASGPPQCNASEVVRYRVTATNTGYARWLRGDDAGGAKGSVHLVAHLFDQSGEPIALYHAGAFLPHDVAPDQSVELEIALQAPESQGNYLLKFDMVSEHVAWFEDLGSEVLKHDLEVSTESGSDRVT